jgi:hypothetical protein
MCRRVRCPGGGASRDRTDDPLLAKQVLSQLSYGPMPEKALTGHRSPRAGFCSLDAGHLCGRLDRQLAVFSL